MVGAQLAVNPRNPNNIVVAAIADTGYTQACAAVPEPPCTTVNTAFGTQAAGLFDAEAGFMLRKVYTSFDGGKTWKIVPLPDFSPVCHPNLYSQNEGGLMAGPNGTFYMSMNTLDWGTPTDFVPQSGVALSKSTDGGLTWSRPVMIGTPADFPYLTVDQVTGRIYSISGLGAPTPLGGPRSVGGPAVPTTYGDAFVASSRDGVRWSTGQRTGGTDGTTQFEGAFGKGIAASFGTVATTFIQFNPAACEFFVGGPAPCTVFQTSRDLGATWTRHRVPVSFNASFAGTQVAADPTRPGHFVVSALNADGSTISVYRTSNNGRTWSAPTVLAGDDGKTHWNPWISFSSRGTLGVVWRTNEGPVSWTPTPYSVWAATSNDGGRTFSPAVQVNCCSPAAKPGAGWLGGNIVQDFSAIGFGPNK
nr:sialidase family protein [Micromonospora sp. DSM 115978]